MFVIFHIKPSLPPLFSGTQEQPKQKIQAPCPKLTLLLIDPAQTVEQVDRLMVLRRRIGWDAAAAAAKLQVRCCTGPLRSVGPVEAAAG